ncbi:hypothetical protein C942_00673 [Photobacterium marinum]|uniref:Flavodoxin n=1 Tax=Photobacterium marinum TaxID=1056511 RepID=L8J9N5_9GAMM|nr:hypothetical protein [Photobacterium marinum]ELR65590.1 hypothetical protein C942_00673 [Photobacterium marinum]
MQSQIEQLIKLKDTWMASHVTEAEFPTPLSQKGLALYQSQQQSSELISSVPDNSALSLSVYPVDCHPLTIRYSVVLSSKWESESDKEAMLEYLTQIMFEEDSPARLFVGFFKGKPAACGMIFQSEDDLTLITDVHALPLNNQQDLISEMEKQLFKIASSEKQTVALNR